MGPDDFIRRKHAPSGHRSPHPPQQPLRRPQNHGSSPRPMQDFIPQRPFQRPVDNLRPRSAAHMPTQNFRASTLSQKPARQPHPHRTSTENQSFERNAEEYKKNKKRRFLSKLKRLVPIAAIGLVVAGVVLFLLFKPDADKSNNKSSQPRSAPLVNPEFTVYYPTSLPANIQTSKGSITYSKDSFTFILEEGGKKSFFVYEQPASTDPNLSSLKSKLAAPKDIALTVGQGIEGALDNGTITAVKTDKNTIIIINCLKTVCSTTPRDILSNMQTTTDLDSLRRSNS